MDRVVGPITLGPNGESMFVTGHATHQSIAEFSIPPLVNTMDRTEMNFGENLQGFATVLDRYVYVWALVYE